MCNCDSRNSGGNWWDDCGCDRNLKVNKLCAHQVESEQLCSRHIDAKDLVAESACVAGNLQAQSLSAGSINSNTLCSMSGTINSLCVDNLSVNNLAANNSLPFNNYRATINFSNDQVYNLGAPLSFNNIVDDPNNNVILSPNTSYTAPVSGYYSLTFKINVTNLTSPNGPVLGTPVADPQIFVNGILVREGFQPFLSFFNAQSFTMSSLITLQAGDVVTLAYNVLGSLGTPIVGTVGIVGSGIEDGNSLFKIILLSALSSSMPAPTPCVVCPPVMIDCGGDCPPCPPQLPPVAPLLNAIVVNPATPSNYNVSWNSVANAHSYTLQQSFNDSSFANPTMMSGRMTSQSFANQPNGTYYYRVFASNKAGNSPFSNVQSVVINSSAVLPVAPVLNAIVVNPATPSNYTVSWNAVASATAYTLQQSLNDMSFSNPTAITLGNVLSNPFVNQPNGTYYYRVLASNSAGNSPFSNVQSVIINAPAPLAATASRPTAQASAVIPPRPVRPFRPH